MAILTDKNALATLAADDVLHVVDVSDTSSNPAGTSKKITVQQILDLAGGGVGTGIFAASNDGATGAFLLCRAGLSAPFPMAAHRRRGLRFAGAISW